MQIFYSLVVLYKLPVVCMYVLSLYTECLCCVSASAHLVYVCVCMRGLTVSIACVTLRQEHPRKSIIQDCSQGHTPGLLQRSTYVDCTQNVLDLDMHLYTCRADSYA